MNAEWEIAAKARTDFADMIEGLTPDQLSHPSLCDDWSVLPPDHIANLRLEATDLDWSWGSGALVRGSGEAVLMGINRRNVEAELEGDGVSQLPKKM